MRQILTKRKKAIVRGPGGYKIIVDLGDIYVSWVITFDGYEVCETKFIVKNLKRGDVFLDVVANLSYYSLLARCIVGQKGTILSFEPCTFVFSLLEETININNLKNVILHDCMLGDINSTIDLAYSKNEYNLGGA